MTHADQGEVVKGQPGHPPPKRPEPASAGSLDNGSQSHGWGRAGGRDRQSEVSKYMTVAKRQGPTNARKMVTVKGGVPEPWQELQARPREEPSTFAPERLRFWSSFPVIHPMLAPSEEGQWLPPPGRL